MRTTLTLDDDVARSIADEVHRTRRSTKEVVNAALRRALLGGGEARRIKPFRVRPHRGGLRVGLDPARMNQLVDELEVEAFVERVGKRGSTRRSRRAAK